MCALLKNEGGEATRRRARASLKTKGQTHRAESVRADGALGSPRRGGCNRAVMAPSANAKLARRMAEGGSAVALTQLGAWYLKGEEGLAQDDVQAVALFRRAADRGFAAAETLLATCYCTGQGVEPDFAQAAEWGRKAADQGDATAQFLVGRLYALGEPPGVKKTLPLGTILGAQRRAGMREGCRTPDGAPQVRGLREARCAPHDMLAVPQSVLL
jgi:TPR repeat protein